MHINDFVHRDIKPENILLDQPDSFDQIYLGDFGSCTPCKDGQKLSKRVGTYNYLAPEILEKNYDKKCDIWSVGIMCFILLTGKFPFSGSFYEETLKKI